MSLADMSSTYMFCRLQGVYSLLNIVLQYYMEFEVIWAGLCYSSLIVTDVIVILYSFCYDGKEVIEVVCDFFRVFSCSSIFL